MANEPNDLLDFEVKKETAIGDIFSQSTIKLKESEGKLDVQQKILEATLDTVTQSNSLKEADLKQSLDKLFEYLESIGVQFEGFKKLNANEQKLIDDAINRKKNADAAVITTDANVVTAEAMRNTWWNRTFNGRNRKIREAKEAATTAKTEAANAEAGIKTAENEAETMFRQRLEKADMQQAMDHIAFITQKAIEQIKKREAEINEAESELLAVLQKGNETRIKAIQQRTVAEEQLEKTKETYQRELDALNKITNQDSEEFTKKKQEVYVLEQQIEEWQAKINVCQAIAESKNSFEKKHNLVLKTLTAQRGNLKAMRGKLQSDLDARASYYESYVIIMKAGNDQKLSEYLEKIGVTTDEGVAEVVAEMYVASSKTRQEMMESIPLHNKRLMNILKALHTASIEIRKKDDELKKSFENFNKNSIQDEFDKSFITPTDNGGEGDKKPVTTGGNNGNGAVDDLLQ